MPQLRGVSFKGSYTEFSSSHLQSLLKHSLQDLVDQTEARLVELNRQDIYVGYAITMGLDEGFDIL